MKSYKKILCIHSALYLTLISQVYAATYTWTGDATATANAVGDWNDARNWYDVTNTTDNVAFVSANTTDLEIAGTQDLDQYTRTTKTIKSLTFTSTNTGDFALRLEAANNTTARSLTFSADTGNSTLTIDAAASGNKIFGPNLDGSNPSTGSVILNSNLDVIHNGSGELRFTNAITGGNNISFAGTGTTVFSGVNTYTGTTTVTGGTLLVNGSTSASSAVTIASGATLGGSGTVGGATTVSGNLNPGNSPGLLTFTNNLILGTTAITTMEIDGSLTRGTDFDGVDVGGALTLDGALVFDLGTTFGEGDYTFDLFDFTSYTGDFSSVTLAGSYTGTLLQTLEVWNLVSGFNTWQFDQSTGELSLSVVLPEPSSMALLALGLVSLMAVRRRKA